MSTRAVPRQRVDADVLCCCAPPLGSGEVWTAAHNGAVVIRDCSGAVLHAAGEHSRVAVTALVATENRVWAGHANGNITVFSTESHARVATLQEGHTDAVLSFAWHADKVYSGGRDFRICQWLASSLQLQRQMPGHAGSVCCLVLASPINGSPRLLCSGAEDRSIRLWDTQKGTCSRRLTCSSPPKALATHQNWLWSGLLEGTVTVHDLRTGEGVQPASAEHGSPVVWAALVPQLGEVWSVAEDKSVLVWDATQPGVPLSFVLPPQFHKADASGGLALAPNATNCVLWTLSEGGSSICTWTLAGNQSQSKAQGQPHNARKQIATSNEPVIEPSSPTGPQRHGAKDAGKDPRVQALQAQVRKQGQELDMAHKLNEELQQQLNAQHKGTRGTTLDRERQRQLQEELVRLTQVNEQLLQQHGLYEQAQSQLQSLRQKKDRLQERKDKLQRDAGELAARLADYTSENDRLAHDLALSERFNDELKKEHSLLRKTLDETLAHKNQLEAEVSELRTHLRQQVTASDECAAQLAEVQALYKDLVQSSHATVSQLNSLKLANERLAAQLRGKENESLDLKSHMEQREKDFVAETAKLSADLQNVSDAASRMQAQLLSTQASLGRKQRQVAVLRHQLRQHQQNSAGLGVLLSSPEESPMKPNRLDMSGQLARPLDFNAISYTPPKALNDEFEIKATRWQHRAESLQMEVETLQSENQQLETELERARVRCRSLDRDLEQAQRHVQDLIEAQGDLRQELLTAQTDLDELRMTRGTAVIDEERPKRPSTTERQIEIVALKCIVKHLGELLKSRELQFRAAEQRAVQAEAKALANGMRERSSAHTAFLLRTRGELVRQFVGLYQNIVTTRRFAKVLLSETVPSNDTSVTIEADQMKQKIDEIDGHLTHTELKCKLLLQRFFTKTELSAETQNSPGRVASLTSAPSTPPPAVRPTEQVTPAEFLSPGRASTPPPRAHHSRGGSLDATADPARPSPKSPSAVSASHAPWPQSPELLGRLQSHEASPPFVRALEEGAERENGVYRPEMEGMGTNVSPKSDRSHISVTASEDEHASPSRRSPSPRGAITRASPRQQQEELRQLEQHLRELQRQHATLQSVTSSSQRQNSV